AAAALGGALHRRVEGWRDAVLDAVALVEVTIDWADEEVPQDVSGEVAARLDPVIGEITAEHAAVDGLERLREGFEVAVVGAPNCGKSSFINYLAAREMAITSPVPGTTRDVIELRYDLRGLPVTFLDMAGLRETADPVECIGVGRAIDRARAADLRLHVEAADARSDAICAGLRMAGDLAVWSKADLGRGPGGHLISTVTGEGVGALLDAIHDRLAARIPQDAVASRARHRAALGETLAALARARAALGSGAPELVAEDLRLALDSLGRLVGRVGVEDMLDRVFANFCLGK
ncbi:MAG: GTPase, partial [Thermohalobaculum sp.]|nr:GTPase [Thermohalobaculum sp.]